MLIELLKTKIVLQFIFSLCLFVFSFSPLKAADQFVVQLTGSMDQNTKQSLQLLQSLLKNNSGKDYKVVIIGYNTGVQSLRLDNSETFPLVKALQKQGVVFKVGRKSMNFWGLQDEQMPVEIEIVPNGLAELMFYQNKGYKVLNF